MRFGLVGTGYWASFTHAPALATTPGATLTAVWGRSAEATSALAARHGAIPCQDFDEFLGRVDAVAFAVPPHVQAPLAIRAAEAGKHLLLEKPIALSAEDADAVVTAVEKAGVASVVFFTWRFNREIRAWLADEQARGGWSGEGWSGGTAIWLGNSLQPDSPFNTPWRQQKGALWDLGPHLVGMLWACLGPVISVTAVAGQGDVTHLVLGHEGGASSTTTMALDAPEAASGVQPVRLGRGRPVGHARHPARPRGSLCAWPRPSSSRRASSGRADHPCDVSFGRDIVRVLAAADAQLPASRSAPRTRDQVLAASGPDTVPRSARPPRLYRYEYLARRTGPSAPARLRRRPGARRGEAPRGRRGRAADHGRARRAARRRVRREDLRGARADHPATCPTPGPATRRLPRRPRHDVRQYGGEGDVAHRHRDSRRLLPQGRLGRAAGPSTRSCSWAAGKSTCAMPGSPSREVSIHVVAIMGGCEITVPEDATVHVTGVGIMGAFEHSVAGAGVPGGPVIHVSGMALMGGVEVKRKPPKKAKRDKLQSRNLGELE